MIRRKRLLTAVLVFSLVTSISAWGQSKPILTVYTYNSFTSEWGPGPTLAKDSEGNAVAISTGCRSKTALLCSRA